MAKQRLEAMAGIPLLRVTDETEELTRRILDSGLLPPDANRRVFFSLEVSD